MTTLGVMTWKNKPEPSPRKISGQGVVIALRLINPTQLVTRVGGSARE